MTWLGYTEVEVWQLSPKKWHTLVHTHIALFKQKWGIEDDENKDKPTGFIDEIGW